MASPELPGSEILLTVASEATPYGWRLLGALIRASRHAISDPHFPTRRMGMESLGFFTGIPQERLRYIEMSRRASPAAKNQEEGCYTCRFDDIRRLAAARFMINVDTNAPYSLDELSQIVTEQLTPKNPLTKKEFTRRDFEQLGLRIPDSLLVDRTPTIVAQGIDGGLKRLRGLLALWLKRVGVSRSQLLQEAKDVIQVLQAQDDVKAEHLIACLYGEAVPSECDVRFLVIFPMYRPGTPIALSDEKEVLCGIADLLRLIPKEAPTSLGTVPNFLNA